MKKPKIDTDEPQSRKVIRADKAPTEGYSLVVDGHWNLLDANDAASQSGIDFLSGFKNRSNRRSYFMGSIFVMPMQYATTLPAAEPRPGPINCSTCFCKS